MHTVGSVHRLRRDSSMVLWLSCHRGGGSEGYCGGKLGNEHVTGDAIVTVVMAASIDLL